MTLDVYDRIVCWLETGTSNRLSSSRFTTVGSDRLECDRKVTLEHKAALAAGAHIRHNRTKHDDRLANPKLILDPHGYLYHHIRSEAEDAVDEFPEKHRKRG